MTVDFSAPPSQPHRLKHPSARQVGDDTVARDWVLACVDASAYASSVCDHAGWFASDPEVGVDVVHVVEDGAISVEANRIVERAVGQLRDEGVGPIAYAATSGDFVETVCAAEAGVVVMGKRGQDSAAARAALGHHVAAVVRQCKAPLCLAPKYFLPLHRALVLLDFNLDHRTALEFVSNDFRLSTLALDVAVIAKPGESVDAKLEWARRMTLRLTAQVFPLACEGLDGAVMQYVQSRAADMIVVSREVLGADPQAQLSAIQQGGLWSTRSPVVIC